MKVFETKNKTKLQYDIWGSLNSNQVCLFFHGFPGSHIQGKFLEEFFLKNNMKLIAVDRPGYGGSSPHPIRSPEAYVDSLLELLDHHNVQGFSVLGVSGGAPLSHIVASRAFARVNRLVIVCGLASFHKNSRPYFSQHQRRLLWLTGMVPSPVLEALANSAMKYYSPEKKMEHFFSFLHESDRLVLSDSRNRFLMLESMRHARLQKIKGILWDAKIYSTDWFEKYCKLQNFKDILVHYFHGKQDKLLNYGMAENMQKRLPHASLKLFDYEGHYSLPFNKTEEILRTLENLR